MKKRIFTIFFLIVFLLAMLGVSGVVAMATFAPAHAGQGLFAIQNWGEHFYEGLIANPANRAQYGLTLLERRLADLEQVRGTDAETVVLNSIAVEIQHVLELFKAATPESEAALRELFVADLNALLIQLDRVEFVAQNSPQALADFRAAMSALRDRAKDSSRSLAGLSDDSGIPANPLLPMPNTLVPGAPGAVDAPFPPRMILFPPGSPGAQHLFFPLDGKHAETTCQTCHTEGNYAGTPNQCLDCHLTNRPAAHFEGQCALCHSTSAWLPSTFDHFAVGAVDCQSCHLEVRPANHYTGQCSACHGTTAWLPAIFNHQTAGAFDCQSCHISKRPANHFPGQCSACHATSAWRPATFNHQVAGATDCQSCHIDRRPANHFAGQCSACHATSVWRPATFNHQFAGATDCQSCHSNRRPANHFSGQCSSCHTTTAWQPASFNHQVAGATDCQSCHLNRRPANHFSGQCSDCHSTSGWLPANFNHTFPIDHKGANGECATCHPSGTSSFTCFNCHNESELTKKHNEKGIPDYVVRCMECHPDGRKND